MSPETLPSQEGPSRLAVLWTSGDREVALNVAFMYTHNAKARGWFDEVTLIVWGPSSRLLSEDEELQEYVVRMEEAGVEVVACRACADTYGVSEILEGMGIEVKYMGEPLTEMLKGDWEILTF
ncbi:MAG: DsrE family protein [Gemmatimonadota bacterium]